MKILNVVDSVLGQVQVGYTLRTFYVFQCEKALGHTPVAVVRSQLALDEGKNLQKTYIRRASLRSRLGRRLRSMSYRLWQRLERGAFVDLIRRAIKAERPDIVHCATPNENFFDALPAARACGIPVVYEVRGFWEETDAAEEGGIQRPEDYRAAKELEAEAVRTADAVVTLGEVMKCGIVELGVRPEKVFVARNGVDCEKFKPQAPDPQLVDSLGLANHFVVGTACNLRLLEGVDSLVVAASLLKDLPLKLLIIGDGVEKTRLERLVRLLGLERTVTFVGRVDFDVVEKYYALLHAYALPRVRAKVCEVVVPLKPLEACAMGLPILASDLPALREVVQEGKTGLLFPADDPTRLASAIRALYEAGPQRQAEVGQMGRQWALESATWDHVAMQYDKVYSYVT